MATNEGKLSYLKASTEALMESSMEMHNKVESHMQKLKQAHEQFVKMEDHLKTELSSQSKLAVFYKDSADEAKKKNEELLTAFEELQKLLKEANKGRLDLGSRLQAQENSHAGKSKEYEEKISELERKLENANDLLAAARQIGAAPLTPVELSTLSPTAALTSSYMKSGMTLTQIYSQYVEVLDVLQQEKDEKIGLKQYLDQILKENEKSKVHADEAMKKNEHLKRENDRLRNLPANLSQQMPDSSFRIPDSVCQIPDSGFGIPDSGFRFPSFSTAPRPCAQVERLQCEMNLLKKKLEAKGKHHRSVISTWENRVQELQSQLNAEIMAHQQAREQLLKSTSDVDSVQLRTSEEFKRTNEGKLKSTEQDVSQYPSLINNQAIWQRLMSGNLRTAELQIMELQERLSKVMAELDEALKKAQTSAAAEMTAKEELKEQAILASEAQDKYERELILHANDVQALTTIKEEFQEQSSKFKEIEDRALAAEQKLQQYASSWEEQKKAKASETKKLEARCADLVNQNSTLHGQLEKLSAQLAASKEFADKVTLPPKEGMTGEGDGEDNKSVEELWEIIRFVRREKEISETKCELSQSESIRYQQRCEYLEGQIEDLQKNITEQRTQSEVDSQTAAQHAEIMEKVEKLNELTEANKVLENEKTNAEEIVRELVVKVQQLEGEMRPLKADIQSMTTQKDALLAEKTALKNEIVRWTAKTNQLSEQYKNVDADEYKRMKEEKKQFQQQISSLKSDNQRMRTQAESLKSELSKTQGELAGQKAMSQRTTDQIGSLKGEHEKAVAKLQEEVATLKSSVNAKTEEVNEKNKTLLQVKRIARRYKTQVDEQTKEMEELKKKVNEFGQPAGEGAAAGTSAPPAENVDMTSYENKIKELTEQLKNAEEEVKKLKELDEQNKASLKEKEDKNKKVLIQAREKLQQLTATKDRLNAENEDLKKKQKSVSDEKDSLGQQLSELEMRLKVLNSQFEGKIARLEKELQDAKEEKDKLEKAAGDAKNQLDNNLQKQKLETEKLQQKLQQYQALIQKQQMRIKSLTAASANSISRPSPGEASGAEALATQEAPTSINTSSALPVSLVPPTATIKPTTTPTTIKRAGPKASIRPIAVAPTQSTPTPTATVLPTVTSTPSETTSAAAVIRGTGTVISMASNVSTSVPTTVSVRPITSTAEEEQQPQIPEGEPEVSSSEVTASEQPQPTPSTAVVSGKRQRDEPEVTDRSTTEVAEGTSAEEEPMTKRIRTAEVQFVGEVGTSQEAVIEATTTEEPVENELGEVGVEASDFLEVYEGEDIGGEEEEEEEVEEEEEEEVEEEEEEEEETGKTVAVETGKVATVAPEVVLIDSDDDEDEEEQEQEEGDEGEYEEDDDGGEYDDEEEEDEMEEGDDDEDEGGEYMGEEGDEGEDEDIEEDEDDGEAKHEVVEVIDDDDDVEDVGEGQAMEDTPLEEEVGEDIEEEDDATERMEEGQDEVEQTETSETTVEREISTTAQHNVPETERQLMEAEHRVTPPTTAPFAQRLLSARSHLPPFSFPQGQPAPGPFNDEEDCMVPSTPTLFVPKRTDGFAEAISSPQINRSSFSFGAPGETSMSSAGGLELSMSEEGLRVDDTQVDLMGGSDEASNERPSFVVPTGLPETSESNSQPNQRLPSTGSDTRQLSLESLESEPDVGSIATVPVIRVTEASEESNEQNVPVSKAHPESLETEVVELLEEAEKLGEEAGSQEAEAKDSEEGTSESASSVKEDISQPGTSGESSSASSQSSTAGSQPSTTAGTGAAAKAKQDPNRPKGTVVQLRRPGTSATWSQTRGGHQVQRGAPASGRVRRLRRDPVRGPSHRGRGTPISRGRASGTPRGGQT